MRIAPLLTLLLLCLESPAFAQGSIGVYADDGFGNMNGESCEIYDGTGPEYDHITLHFVHLADVCASSVEFRVDVTQLSILGPATGSCSFPLKIGSFRNGISIAYQAELSGQIYLGSITLPKSSTYKHLCKYVYVKNHPSPSVSGVTHPIAVNCNHPKAYLDLMGSFAIVSYDFTNCPCPGTVPVEESSWGKIKSLYE
jgi:hypothetical protein